MPHESHVFNCRSNNENGNKALKAAMNIFDALPNGPEKKTNRTSIEKDLKWIFTVFKGDIKKVSGKN